VTRICNDRRPVIELDSVALATNKGGSRINYVALLAILVKDNVSNIDVG
jgi:hypothetical protein